MARSLLPSTWRGASRAKASVKRAARRRVSQAMAALAEDPEGWDDADAVFDDSGRALRQVVGQRRSADKLNPFIRWATATTAHLPLDAWLDHVRAVLPRGLIGDHARSHLARLPGFSLAPRRVWEVRRTLLSRGHLTVILREAVGVPGGHAFVNEVLSRHALVDGLTLEPVLRARVRLLHGVHDVGALLDALEAPAMRPLRVLLDAVCRALWEQRFDLEAARAALPSPVVVPPRDVVHVPSTVLPGRG